MRQKALPRSLAPLLLGLVLVTGPVLAQPQARDPAVASIDPLAPVMTEAREQAIAAVKDEATRNALADMLGILRHMQRVELPYRQAPGQTVYAPSRLAVLSDYPDAQTMIDVYAAGIVGGVEPDGSISVIPPFTLPYLHTFDWRTISYSGGPDIPAESEEGPAVTLQRKNPKARGVVVPATDPEGAVPTVMTGRLNVEMPKSVAEIAFSRNEIGEVKAAGDYLFKLTAIEGHRVELETWHRDGGVPGFASDGVIVEARDTSGKFLGLHARLWEVPDQFQRGLIKLDELTAQARAGKFRAKDTTDLLQKAGWRDAPATMRGRLGFKGTVDSVRVTMMVREGEHFTPVTRDLATPVLPINRGVNAEGMTPLKLAGAAYDHELATELRDGPLEIERKEMAKRIKVDVVQLDGYPVVRFSYPDVLSNRFFQTPVRFGLEDAESVSVTFYDAAGKPLAGEEGRAWGRVDEGIGYDPGGFSGVPVRAAGQIAPRRVADLPRRTLTPGKLPDGIEIDRNMVTVDTSRHPYDTAGMLWLAKDATGRYLVLTGRMALNDPESGNTSIVHYFQGDVATLETIERGKVERVPFKFDVRLPTPG